MGTTPVAFTGSSLFATDLQNSINRALAIAALPLQQLNNEKTDLSSQLTELNQVNSLFSNLQSAISSLASATSTGAVSTGVSDNTVVTASATSSALPGTYNVQVLDPGSFSSSISNNATKVTDPTTQNISSQTTFTLTVNSTTYHPTGSNLNALAASINQSGAPVQATVINIGTPSAADYRLAVQATNVGSNTIQLSDGTNLLNSLAGGSNASYTVNGQPTTPGGISSPSRTVTIAPGLTANLEKAGSATITVAGSTAGISNALSAFANAYNGVVDELAKNRGQNAGALNGDSILLTAGSALNTIANYSGNGSGFNSLESLGVGFDQNGHLQFDPTKIGSLSQSQITQLTAFLGSPTTGGFLQTATTTLTGLEDPTNGLITQAVTSLNSQITNQQSLIDAATTKVSDLQTSLQTQMAAADSLIASLEQQGNFITSLFNQLNANAFANK